MKINYTGDGIGLHQEQQTEYIVNANKEKQLFNLLGDLLQREEKLITDRISIFKTTLENEISYRVYIDDLCIDSYKEEEESEIIYGMYCGWHGFRRATIEQVLILIKSIE
ncbi:hypothetical protein HX049_17870 [Myroides odoratimimus]|uniref:hypothetical protein n=1 Tax=Myroides odoratimimus TaxID=76832 RepID=UPI002578126A|nr:hypothetical protein [Myroides odoratimimus]MDM1399004.1 hypothetical protein [Myroides odoratimimus]